MTAALAPELAWRRRSRDKAEPITEPESLAACAVDCLLCELETWPKPGLVSHIDSSSHDDMDAALFRTSAAAIQPFFAALAEAGSAGAPMALLRILGLDAEAAMLTATGGVNTHRGAIFGLGLLCAAAGARSAGRVAPGLSLGATVVRLWGADILNGTVAPHSHGSTALRRYGSGGARVEAALAFPSVYHVGVPALRLAFDAAPADPGAQGVEACFALIAMVEDTNLLHRGGRAELVFARRAARRFLDAGGISAPRWRDRALAVHQDFVRRRPNPGGSADLLAMSLFVNAQEKRLT